MTRLLLRGPGAEATRFTLRHRWFPWGTENVTLFGTVYAKHYDDLVGVIKAGTAEDGWAIRTLRHESCHVRQYETRGWLWVITHPSQREREAVLAQSNDQLKIELVG